jgi:hypothetical protein
MLPLCTFQHTNADQTSEGPSLKTWGIAGSAVTGKVIKRKLGTKSMRLNMTQF